MMNNFQYKILKFLGLDETKEVLSQYRKRIASLEWDVERLQKNVRDLEVFSKIIDKQISVEDVIEYFKYVLVKNIPQFAKDIIYKEYPGLTVDYTSGDSYGVFFLGKYVGLSHCVLAEVMENINKVLEQCKKENERINMSEEENEKINMSEKENEKVNMSKKENERITMFKKGDFVSIEYSFGKRYFGHIAEEPDSTSNSLYYRAEIDYTEEGIPVENIPAIWIEISGITDGYKVLDNLIKDCQNKVERLNQLKYT